MYCETNKFQQFLFIAIGVIALSAIMRHTIHTSKANSCPLQIHMPEIVLLLFSPNTMALPKACFRIRSSRWNIPEEEQESMF